MKARLFFSLAGALALAACGDTDTEATDATPAAEDTLATPTETATPAMTAQAFADAVAASDMYEIEAGRLAQDMGTSEEVRDFGAMMVEDHTTSSENLKAAAAEAEPALTVAPKLMADQQAQLDELRQAGDRFDAVYAQQQVAAHEKALALLQGYANSGGPEPLTGFASETATVVEGHLDQARGLSAG